MFVEIKKESNAYQKLMLHKIIQLKCNPPTLSANKSSIIAAFKHTFSFRQCKNKHTDLDDTSQQKHSPRDISQRQYISLIYSRVYQSKVTFRVTRSMTSPFRYFKQFIQSFHFIASSCCQQLRSHNHLSRCKEKKRAARSNGIKTAMQCNRYLLAKTMAHIQARLPFLQY